ncbi:UNVERIFIED_CONTAM: hypothetical protein Slati_0628100 [Sesamum latifolium]|uniref:Nuclear speckle splicing regulatory protein 1 N-terminal domain-containing protein n=1 Tax=Sesamum latifolium TaxID=2727402 RepID=A0AAW2Y2S9_9LAMI
MADGKEKGMKKFIDKLLLLLDSCQIEEQHKKALEEDPSVFDYDGVYDKMKEKQVRPIQLDRQDRKPRYIQALMDKAKQREREHEVIYERKLAKERSEDQHLYADKDKFVTSAYKKKLAEQAKWLEEERLRDMREEKEDVTKTDLSDFYFNLAKNVAFGATEADSRKPGKQPEEVVVQQPVQVSHPATSSDLESSRTLKSHQDETATSVSPKGKPEGQYTTPTSDTSRQDQITNGPSVSNQPTLDHQNTNEDAVVAAKDHHKRSEDAVAAAKERFLARKKAKVL